MRVNRLSEAVRHASSDRCIHDRIWSDGHAGSHGTSTSTVLLHIE